MPSLAVGVVFALAAILAPTPTAVSAQKGNISNSTGKEVAAPFVQRLVAGAFGRIKLHTNSTPGLELAGMVRLRPSSWVCGSPGTLEMSTAVQPPCAGHICLGPTQRAGAEVAWAGVRIIRSGRYRLCWCEPRESCAGIEVGRIGPGCCLTDSAFSHFAGDVEIEGPSWISLSPLLGMPFQFTLRGPSVGAGSRALLRIRTSSTDWDPCRGLRTEAEKQASSLSLIRSSLRSVDNANELPVSFKCHVFRYVTYVVCWCAGQSSSCQQEDDFVVETGLIMPVGPFTEAVVPLHAIVGSPFKLRIFGDRFHIGDRIRIIEAEHQCGTDHTSLARAVGQSICGRGEGSCVTSPVYGGPPTEIITSPAGSRSPKSEAWEPVAVYAPGVYRLCWCVDESWDPVRLESYGYCSWNWQFAVPVGHLLVQGIFESQQFNCSAFGPCSLNLTSEVPLNTADAILIADPTRHFERCGRGIVGHRVSVVHLFSMKASSLHNSSGGRNATDKMNNATDNRTIHVGEFALSNAGPPGHSKVCYCSFAAMGPCNDPAAFGQLAGILQVSDVGGGLTAYQDSLKVCNSLQPCTFTVSGLWAIQAAEGDAFYAVPEGSKCGDGDDSFSVFTMTRKFRLPTGEWEASFGNGAYPAGDYRLCFCDSSSAPEGGCTSPQHFRANVAPLIVVGSLLAGSWSCGQGLHCNITMSGWRLNSEDRLLLVEDGEGCFGQAGKQPRLGAAFGQNPTSEPYVESAPDGFAMARFAFGRGKGVGHWQVCLCAAITTLNGCSSNSYFVQNVGRLRIDGALSSVEPLTTLPSTVSMVSVLVTAAVPGQLTCAVAQRIQAAPPGNTEVLDCKSNMDGCIGAATLRWRARLGPNRVHIPITLTGTGSGSLPVVHVWCVGDLDECPSSSCALPPNPVGVLIQLHAGVRTGQQWNAVRGLPFKVSVQGDPTNTEGGRLRLLPEGEDCQVSKGNGVLRLGLPSSVVPQKASVWSSLVLVNPGNYGVCWCDRGWGTECAQWQRIGQITVAGPTNASKVPEMVNPGKSFFLKISGVALAADDQLMIVHGEECSLFNSSNRSTGNHEYGQLRWSTGSTAKWELMAPGAAGNITVCWFRGAAPPVALGRSRVEEYRNCSLSAWEPASAPEAPKCSRMCGGGVYKMQRHIDGLPSGGGQECPPPEVRQRWEPCNTQPCPEVLVHTACTKPAVVREGTAFQVIVTGEALDPDEDRVLIVPSTQVCGRAHKHFGGAACKHAQSNKTYLVCGDGKMSVRIDAEGQFQVCLCDASAEGPQNVTGGTLPSDSSCSNISSYSLTPSAGTVINVLPTNQSLPQPGGEGIIDIDVSNDTGGTKPLKGTTAHKSSNGFSGMGNKTTNSLLIAGVVVGIMLHVCAATFAVWRWRSNNAETVPKKPTKPSVVAQSSIVSKATQEVWDAYARTMVESMTWEEVLETSKVPVELVAVDEDCDPEEPEFESAACELSCPSSRSVTPPLRGNTPSIRGVTPALRTATPPLPPGTADSLKSRRSSATPPLPPGTADSCNSRLSTGGRSGASSEHPSLVKVTLPPHGFRGAAPVQGGSFLDLPLMGKTRASPTPAPTQGSRPSSAVMKTTGSTWWGDSDVSPPSRPSSPGVSAETSPRMPGDEPEEEPEDEPPSGLDSVPRPPPPPHKLERPSTPLDLPPCLPHVLPLELPESPGVKGVTSRDSCGAPATQLAAAQVKAPTAVHTPPPPASSPGLLRPPSPGPHASSTARPPGEAPPTMPSTSELQPCTPSESQDGSEAMARPPGDAPPTMLSTLESQPSTPSESQDGSDGKKAQPPPPPPLMPVSAPESSQVPLCPAPPSQVPPVGSDVSSHAPSEAAPTMPVSPRPLPGTPPEPQDGSYVKKPLSPPPYMKPVPVPKNLQVPLHPAPPKQAPPICRKPPVAPPPLIVSPNQDSGPGEVVAVALMELPPPPPPPARMPPPLKIQPPDNHAPKLPVLPPKSGQTSTVVEVSTESAEREEPPAAKEPLPKANLTNVQAEASCKEVTKAAPTGSVAAAWRQLRGQLRPKDDSAPPAPATLSSFMKKLPRNQVAAIPKPEITAVQKDQRDDSPQEHPSQEKLVQENEKLVEKPETASEERTCFSAGKLRSGCAQPSPLELLGPQLPGVPNQVQDSPVNAHSPVAASAMGGSAVTPTPHTNAEELTLASREPRSQLQGLAEAQERLRAEWHAQLAADSHLRPGASLRSSMAPRRGRFSLSNAVGDAEDLPKETSTPSMGPPCGYSWRHSRDGTVPANPPPRDAPAMPSMGPLVGPPLPGMKIAGPPLPGMSSAASTASSWPLPPMPPPMPGAQPSWAFYAP